MKEVDVANALRSFAHFKHFGTETALSCLESLVRTTIKSAQGYKLKTLAVISNSLAELNV